MATIKGGDKLKATLAALSRKVGRGAALRVGFLEGSTYPDGTSLPMVAAVQNFGSPAKGIPPRPFFTNMVADKSPGWGPALGRILDANDLDAEKSLRLMGEGIKGQLQQAIVDTNAPANSPVTDLLKQRFPMGGHTFADLQDARRDVANGETAPAGKPLVWTSHMLNSVDYEVDAT